MKRILLLMFTLLAFDSYSQTIQIEYDSVIMYCDQEAFEKAIRKVGCKGCEEMDAKSEFIKNRRVVNDTIHISSEDELILDDDLLLDFNHEFALLLNKGKMNVSTPEVVKYKKVRNTEAQGLTYSYYDKYSGQLILDICLKRHKF